MNRHVTPGKMGLPLLAAGLMLSATAASCAPILFEDSFDGDVMSPQWVTKAPTQWVADGWLHTKDTDGWPRDSLATVHDGDPTWRDYRFSVMADFVDPTPWQHINILFHTNNFLRTSGGSSGSAYELQLFGSGWLPEDQNRITLNRTDHTHGTSTLLASTSWILPSHPMLIETSMVGGHIQVWVDEQPVFDLVDSSPLAYGGIGVHAIWEAEARYDSVRVTAIPEPSSGVLAGAGLVALLAWRRRPPGRRG